jgi:hypothetical protein
MVLQRSPHYLEERTHDILWLYPEKCHKERGRDEENTRPQEAQDTQNKRQKRKTQIERADRKKNKGTNKRIKTTNKNTDAEQRNIEGRKKRRKIQRGNRCTEDK